MRGLALVITLAAAGSALADGHRSSRLPPPGTYRFTFELSYPDSGARVPKGTYRGVIVVDRSGKLTVSTDEAGKTIVYRGPLTRSIPWQRGMRLILMRDETIALHDARELLYGCGTYEDDNGKPCVEVLERIR